MEQNPLLFDRMSLKTISTFILVNIVLFEWLLVNHSLKGEFGDINYVAVAVEDDVTDDASCGNALLNAMATKSVDKEEIGDDRVWP